MTASLGSNGLLDWNLATATERHVRECLTYCEGNVQWAASELDVSANTVRKYAFGEPRTSRLQIVEREA